MLRLGQTMFRSSLEVLSEMRLKMVAAVACLWISQWSADPLLAQTQSLSQGTNRIEIQLERKDADTWRAVDPGLVFLQQDLVRFKVKINFSGYLYVLNQGTSGEYTLLFPRAETGQENRVEPNRDYIVPALRELGFKFVTLDLEGFRTGSMNELIPLELKRQFALDQPRP